MSSSCSTCGKSKAGLVCAGCGGSQCKACAQFVDEETFSYLELPEEKQMIGAYCSVCYERKIAPAVASYEEIMARARDVSVFFIDQGKETRTIKRSDYKFKISNCPDRDETVLRLAFKAAQAGFNSIVDVETDYTKVRDGSFKLSHWSGSGTAARLDNADWFAGNKRRSPSR